MAALALSALALGSTSALEAKGRQTGEEKLARLLDGRVAGAPRSCIPNFIDSDMRVIDKTAIVYRAGGTIWVNRPVYPENLDKNDILVVSRFSHARLCKRDSINIVDATVGGSTGVVFLQDFVPYTKSGS